MQVQIYADTFSAEAEADTMNITLTNVDLGLLFGQFSTDDILSQLEYSDIIDWVHGQESDE